MRLHSIRLRVRFGALVSIAVLFDGCAQSAPAVAPDESGQSFCDAMKVICDVDRLAGLTSHEDPIDVSQKRADFIRDHVMNGDAIYLRTLWSTQAAGERAKDMRVKASEVGVASCPLADSLEREGDL
jgi:hypothetical protein